MFFPVVQKWPKISFLEVSSSTTKFYVSLETVRKRLLRIIGVIVDNDLAGALILNL